MKNYLVLAEIELNINDEYCRFVDNVLVAVVKADTREEAEAKCGSKAGDDLENGRIFEIKVREI